MDNERTEHLFLFEQQSLSFDRLLHNYITLDVRIIGNKFTNFNRFFEIIYKKSKKSLKMDYLYFNLIFILINLYAE